MLKKHLDGLPIRQIRYFHVTGSTNDEALAWCESGAEDGCLVVADQQTQGRGRLGRRWITNPGAALAFSLILRPTAGEREHLGMFSPLAALAICQAVEAQAALHAEIKWPNDVLLLGKKTAGILAEAAWQAEIPQAVVIGVGVNVRAEAVPPPEEVMFPATSVEQAAGQEIERWKLLRDILQSIYAWRQVIGQAAFVDAWSARLAFRGAWVRVEETAGAVGGSITGQVVGIDEAGCLVLQTADGKMIPIQAGDVHLRPA